MSYLESISRVRPVSAPQTLFEALPLEDAYWDFCTSRAGEHYGHSFSDSGFEIATGELKVDRKQTRFGLEFDFSFFYEYEHHLSIDDSGVSGAVYVRVPSSLTFVGLASGAQAGLLLDYRLCVQALSIRGYQPSTHWDSLGDQSVHALFAETIKGGVVAADSPLMKDLFPEN